MMLHPRPTAIESDVDISPLFSDGMWIGATTTQHRFADWQRVQ